METLQIIAFIIAAVILGILVSLGRCPGALVQINDSHYRIHVGRPCD